MKDLTGWFNRPLEGNKSMEVNKRDATSSRWIDWTGWIGGPVGEDASGREKVSAEGSKTVKTILPVIMVSAAVPEMDLDSAILTLNGTIYPHKVLKESVSKFSSAPVYVHHDKHCGRPFRLVEAGDDFPALTIDDKYYDASRPVGRIVYPWWDDTKKWLLGMLQLIDPFWNGIIEAAGKHSKLSAFQISPVTTVFSRENEYSLREVTGIESVKSVDLVEESLIGGRFLGVKFSSEQLNKMRREIENLICGRK
jgi:hypothetical protein